MKKTASKFTSALLLMGLLAAQVPGVSAQHTDKVTKNVWLASGQTQWSLNDAGDQNVSAVGFTFRSANYSLWMRGATFTYYADEDFDGDFEKNGDGLHEINNVIEEARLVDKRGHVLATAEIEDNGEIVFSDMWVYLTKGKQRNLYVEVDLEENAPDIAFYIDIEDVHDDLWGEQVLSSKNVHISDAHDNFPNNKGRMVHVYAE